MEFNQRDWVSEIVTTTVTSAIAGVVGLLFASDYMNGLIVVGAAVAGLVVGLVNLPLKWLLDRRPSANSSEWMSEKDRPAEAKGPHEPDGR
jgi:hypothetical protein